MNRGKLGFAQLMQHLPLTTFRRCVIRYRGEFKVKSFSCLDQFLCMAFAQLTYRESLRDIEVCLRAQSSKLYHLGIRSAVARGSCVQKNCATLGVHLMAAGPLWVQNVGEFGRKLGAGGSKGNTINVT